MCCYFKWCIKRTSKSKRHNPIIWIVFIAILLLIDICVSQNGYIILMPKPSTSQTISGELPVLEENYVNRTVISNVKESIEKNTPILNVTSSRDFLSDLLFSGEGCVVHLIYNKYSATVSLYILLVMFTNKIIFFLEKILLFIQNNDGKKKGEALGTF